MTTKTSILFLLLLYGSLHLSAQDLLQTPISLDKRSGTRAELLSEIFATTGIEFAYNPQFISADEFIELETPSGTLESVLLSILPGLPVSFEVRDRKVLILSRKRENQKTTLKGTLREASSGEILIGATILLRSMEHEEQQYGVVSNLYGFYSITVPAGAYQLTVSYVGFRTETSALELETHQTIHFDLVPSSTQLDEVIVETRGYLEEPDHLIRSSDLGKNTLDIGTIRKMPALFGEVDPIKSIQQLPGVNVSGEGSTNFFVRGGNADHNLIQLDEATVYNASHMMGFISVFNPDALNYLQFYRGHMPSQFGGRLSSLLDIRMRDGDDSNHHLSGGIGITSSRLTAEGPIVKERSSYIVSARRTYLDQFLRFSQDEFTRNTRIYFYDLNAKLNYRINAKNRIFLSGYFGRDLNKILALQYVIDWGNATGTFRWNHVFSDRIFSNTTLLYSKYDYLIDLSDENTPFNWRSKVEDITFKEDLDFYPNPTHSIKAGFQSTLHQFQPGRADENPNEGVPSKKALESAIYYNSEFELGDRWLLNAGLRYSIYQLFGSTTLFEYDADFSITREYQTSGNKIYQTYHGPEPRLSARYLLNDASSVKFSYNKNRQYMQLLSNLSLGLNVFDIWYPATNKVRPQVSDQWSFGYFRNFGNDAFEFSSEVYYKDLQNQVDYEDHSSLIMNRELEGALRTGKGQAYGIELTLQKRGRLNGWISYNYSRTERRIEGINNYEAYPALFDQPHTVSVVGNYALSDRWGFSFNWNFASGRPITLPEETFRYDGYIVPIYGAKNGGRLPDYHRLDLSFTLYPKEKPGRKNESSWNFSLYNVYSRKNAASVFVTSELEGIDLVKNRNQSAFHKLSLFGIIPSVTYNFNF